MTFANILVLTERPGFANGAFLEIMIIKLFSVNVFGAREISFLLDNICIKTYELEITVYPGY